jgi:hypothetical protein
MMKQSEAVVDEAECTCQSFSCTFFFYLMKLIDEWINLWIDGLKIAYIYILYIYMDYNIYIWIIIYLKNLYYNYNLYYNIFEKTALKIFIVYYDISLRKCICNICIDIIDIRYYRKCVDNIM